MSETGCQKWVMRVSLSARCAASGGRARRSAGPGDRAEARCSASPWGRRPSSRASLLGPSSPRPASASRIPATLVAEEVRRRRAAAHERDVDVRPVHDHVAQQPPVAVGLVEGRVADERDAAFPSASAAGAPRGPPCRSNRRAARARRSAGGAPSCRTSCGACRRRSRTRRSPTRRSQRGRLRSRRRRAALIAAAAGSDEGEGNDEDERVRLKPHAAR